MRLTRSINNSYKVILSILALFLAWRLLLATVVDFTLSHYAVTPSFPYYNELLDRMSPKEAVWAHFDGIHYLRLARYLYEDTGTQAFFPLYPLAVRGIGQLGFELEPSAFFLNTVFLLCGLIALYYLRGSYWPLVMLLIFPTSFFFGAIYTESLFFTLSMIFFLALKRRHFAIAALVAGLASSTRLVGVFLSLSLIIEYYQYQTNNASHNSLFIIRNSIFLFILSISGYLGFSYFLYREWHDPLMFFHVQSMFGGGRSSGELILLPQVLYRYVKMIFTVDPSSLLYQRIWLELVMFVGAATLWFKNYKKIPLSHSAYTGLSILLPTLTGTLSSLPRYLLVLTPFLIPLSPRFRLLIFPFVLLLIYFFSLYARGIFVG